MKWLGDRFWSKVDKSGGAAACWPWTAAKTAAGYGRLGERYAHRLSYEDARGEIQAGLVIDHLCRTRACVNPSHMEAVTNEENCARGMSRNAINDRKTACVNGHPFDDDNTYFRKDRPGQRQCKACALAATRSSRYRKAA